MSAAELPDRCEVLVIGAGLAAARHLSARARDTHVVDAADVVPAPAAAI